MTAPRDRSRPVPSRALVSPSLHEQLFFHTTAFRPGCRLDRPSLRVGRPGDDEQAAAGLVGSGDESAHGPESKVGMDSKGVSGERHVGSEVRLGVGIVGGSDISPLGIQDDQESVPLGFGNQALERPDPSPPVPLVEGCLGFDEAHGAGGLEHDVGKPVKSVRRIPQLPCLQKRA